MRTRFTLLLAMMLLVTSMADTTFAGKIIYVDCHTRGGNNGSSWADAYIYLQDGLAAASGCGPRFLCEVRVANGIYKPDQGVGITPGDREATFELRNYVPIIGGYAGFGEPDPNVRDPNIYETILSGDLAGDDGPDFANNAENSYHVLTANNVFPDAILDGFIITGGNANGPRVSPLGWGGGMYNSGSRPTLTNCTFTQNSAQQGGGVYNGNSSPKLTNCNFSGNKANDGGGMLNALSTPNLTNCTFSGNSATGSGGAINNYRCSPNLIDCSFTENLTDGHGGAMLNGDSSPSLTNCTFTQNSAGLCGGGMCNWMVSKPRLTNCIFRGNYAQDGGGMHNYESGGSPVLTNCAFIANWAVISGGGMRNAGSGTVMTNCTFSGNEAGEGAGLFNASGNTALTNCILWDPDWSSEIWTHNISAITVSYSDVRDGWPGEGNINADPCFVDPEGPDGIPGTEDDNLRLCAGSLCIDAGDNTAVPAGITTDLDGNPRFVDDPNTMDRGKGTPPIVDMGAYEGAQGPPTGVCGDSGHPYPKGDLNKDCYVNFKDFAEFADNWLVCTAPECD